METILLFDYVTFTAKNGTEYIKTLIITTSDSGGYNGYTSFSKFDSNWAGLISSLDTEHSIKLNSLSFVGRLNSESRYSVLLEYLNVDGMPQIMNVIYNKIY